MKKYIISIIVAVLFIGYVVYQRTIVNTHSQNPAATALINSNEPAIPSPVTAETNTNSNQNISSNANTSTGTTKTTTNTNTSNPPTVPVPTPVPTQTGKYKNGVYTGTAADAFYGNVQVRATVTNGKLASIEFLQYPNDRDNSIRINTRALPILRSEAIAAQSAQVDIVSGATDSSRAFIESLTAALAQA